MRYVESSACHVGGHQDGLPLASERIERTQPLCLGKENHCEDDKEYSVGLRELLATPVAFSHEGGWLGSQDVLAKLQFCIGNGRREGRGRERGGREREGGRGGRKGGREGGRGWEGGGEREGGEGEREGKEREGGREREGEVYKCVCAI